jgi:pimeloyl-ACP methyl ester carboxylesterase
MWTVSCIVAGVIGLVLGATWLALRGPDIPYAALEARYAGADSHFVELPGGFRVHYREEGEPSGLLVLLLHGLGDSFTTWEGWVAELRDRFHIICLDLPGHGLTRAPDGYVLRGAGLADFVDAFAAALDLPPFAVAGNSMGGGVAWQLAVRHPARISALILVNAVGFANEKPGDTPLAFKILRYRLVRSVLRNVDPRPLIGAGLKFDVYDKTLITRGLVARWAELQRAPGHRAILMSLDLEALGGAAAAPLDGIRVPTLVLQGQDDPLIEAGSAAKFAAAIPGARLLLYERVGHLPQLEIPQRSARDAAEFLVSSIHAARHSG